MASADIAQRVQHAADLRRGRQLAVVRRRTRRAERAALQARLTLARIQ
jgi:hypothetical protein